MHAPGRPQQPCQRPSGRLQVLRVLLDHVGERRGRAGVGEGVCFFVTAIGSRTILVYTLFVDVSGRFGTCGLSAWTKRAGSIFYFGSLPGFSLVLDIRVCICYFTYGTVSGYA